MVGELQKQAKATGPVYDLVASMRRLGALLHSPLSQASDGTLTPTGEVALEQLEDAIAELLSEGVEPVSIPDVQALSIYAQARMHFALKSLALADFDRTERHITAALILMGKASRGLEQVTGISAEQLGNQKVN